MKPNTWSYRVFRLIPPAYYVPSPSLYYRLHCRHVHVRFPHNLIEGRVRTPIGVKGNITSEIWNCSRSSCPSPLPSILLLNCKLMKDPKTNGMCSGLTNNPEFP